MSGGASGQAPNGCFATINVNNDTGLALTAAVGGTFQDVKGTTNGMVVGPASRDGSLTCSAVTGVINVPVAKAGKYRFIAAGTVLPAASKTVLIRGAVSGVAFAGATGEPAARIVGGATPVETPFAVNTVVDVPNGGDVTVQFSSTTTADAVNFKRLQFSLELLES